MIIDYCEQRSEEWFQKRCGIPSASNFDKIITPASGSLSKQADKYMLQLAGERILGYSEDTFQSAAMLRGTEMEAEAVKYYELVTDRNVQSVGMVFSDDKRILCSPDGLIFDGDNINRGLEIKCPIISTHVEYLLKDELPIKYKPQVQGSLYITELEYWSFLSYFPGLPPLLYTVVRDEPYIKKMAAELNCFCDELAEMTEKLRTKI